MKAACFQCSTVKKVADIGIQCPNLGHLATTVLILLKFPLKMYYVMPKYNIFSVTMDRRRPTFDLEQISNVQTTCANQVSSWKAITLPGKPCTCENWSGNREWWSKQWSDHSKLLNSRLNHSRRYGKSENPKKGMKEAGTQQDQIGTIQEEGTKRSSTH